MKLDGDQILHNGAAGIKPECKLVDSNDNTLKSAGFWGLDGSVEENQKGSLSDQKDMRDGADQFSFRIDGEGGWNASEPVNSAMVDNSEKSVKNFVTPVPPNHSSLKPDPFVDSVFYVDKSVVERELPELVVCFEENTYQIVKDICVDEGLPLEDKCLFKSDADVDQKHVCIFPHPENELQDEMVEGKVDLDVQVSDALKSSVGKGNLELHQCVADETEVCEVLGSQSDLQQRGDEMVDKTKEMENKVPEKSPSHGQLLLMPDICGELSCPKPSSDSTENSTLISSQKSTEDPQLNVVSSCEECGSRDKEGVLLSPDVVSAAKEPDPCSKDVNLTNLSLSSAADKLDCCFQKIDIGSPIPIPVAHEPEIEPEEADLARPVLTSQADDVDITSKQANLNTDAVDLVSDKVPDNDTDELTNHTKVENGDIASKLDSSVPAPNCGEVPNGVEVHLGTQGTAGPLNAVMEPVSDVQRNSLGETSFCASGPPSGLITYSGPITHLGSVSVRSDSSTTSTRSFAFPTLQPEWNSSPVKMAKADRKHFRKHRGWRHGLLCCQF